MGNLCPWCCKNPDDSENQEQPPTDRTPLLPKPNSHVNQNDSQETTIQPGQGTPPETNSAQAMAKIVEKMLPDLIDVIAWDGNTNQQQTVPPTTNGLTDSENGNGHLIGSHSGGGGGGTGSRGEENDRQTKLIKTLTTLIQKKNYNLVNNSQTTSANTSNSYLLSSSSSILPDCGSTALVSILSAKPVSQEHCHYVTTLANDINRLIIEEFKISHKEDLVVNFE